MKNTPTRALNIFIDNLLSNTMEKGFFQYFQNTPKLNKSDQFSTFASWPKFRDFKISQFLKICQLRMVNIHTRSICFIHVCGVLKRSDKVLFNSVVMSMKSWVVFQSNLLLTFFSWLFCLSFVITSNWWPDCTFYNIWWCFGCYNTQCATRWPKWK